MAQRPLDWNEFAHKPALNTLVGCSRTDCTVRKNCWGRIQSARSRQHCQRCYDFVPHRHPERWDKFRPRAGQRVPWNYKGDMGDPAFRAEVLKEEFIAASDLAITTSCVFLVQTRHSNRLARFATGLAVSGAAIRMRDFEFGTSLNGPKDLENVRALGLLPPRTVRFLSLEPCDDLLQDIRGNKDSWRTVQDAIILARPHWAYIGYRNPTKESEIAYRNQLRPTLVDLTEWMKTKLGTKIIYKRNCRTDLHHQNSGVKLP